MMNVERAGMGIIEGGACGKLWFSKAIEVTKEDT
jgi:hypothetical protein